MSEWIEWQGGVCPVNDTTVVDLKFRCGEFRNHREPWCVDWQHEAQGKHHVDAYDVVAYRLSEQQSMEEAYEQTHKEISDSALDVQVGGDHYKKCGIQPITYIHANKIGFMEGNAIKYLSRWRDKGGVDDLKKAKHYIEMLIELEGK